MLVKVRYLVIILGILSSLMLMGCSGKVHAEIINADPLISPTSYHRAIISATPFQAVTNTPVIVPPTHTLTPTFTPTITETPTPTETPMPSPTFTPVFEWNPAGHITAPILMYHHVSDDGFGNRYYVTVDEFRTQMEALRDWGYMTVTPSHFIDVLINGGNMPNRPVVITFDDGNIDVYQNAYPIMSEMGFVGVFYIVANRLQSNGYVNAEQLQEMADAGWEIGSHSMSHVDLTLSDAYVRYEVLQSRVTLEDATGRSITTFAYPYGLTNTYVTNQVSNYGYQAGMGLGSSWEHALDSLFYLSRIEVKGSYNLSSFAAILPWSDH